LAEEQKVAGESIPSDAAVIEVHVRELAQLFNSMDPSPFLEKDLDPDAEEFIVGWARELPAEKPLALLVHLDKPVVNSREAETLRDAVHTYFTHRSEIARQRLRELLRIGRTSLAIGVLFLTICLLIADSVMRLWPEHRASTVVREGLTICGWVAMWRPLEIFLYSWWPIERERRTYDRLSAMTVRIACTGMQSQDSPEMISRKETHT
jgi:hypothetical protein